MTRWIIAGLCLLAFSSSPAHAHPPAQDPAPAVKLELNALPEVDYSLGTFTLPAIRIEPLPQALEELGSLLRYQVTLRDGGRVVHQFPAKAVDLRQPGLTIPLAELPEALIPADAPKRYTVQIELLTPEGVLASSEALSFAFPPQPRTTPIWRYVLIVAGALAAAGAAIAFWRTRRRPAPAAIRGPYNPPTAYQAAPLAAPYRHPSAPQAAPPLRAAAPPARQPVDSDATQIFYLPSAAGQPRLRMRVVETPDPTQRREETVTIFPCTIGRGEATVQILGDTAISRVHAVFQLHGGNLTVTDLGSSNGVFVSGSRPPPHQPVPLSGPTNVRIGLFTTVEVELKG